MLFVYLKVLYDSSPVVKVLFWLFVIYLVVYVAYNVFGWIGLIGLLGFILAGALGVWLDLHPPFKTKENKESEKIDVRMMKADQAFRREQFDKRSKSIK